MVFNTFKIGVDLIMCIKDNSQIMKHTLRLITYICMFFHTGT